jgi:glutaredoxin
MERLVRKVVLFLVEECGACARVAEHLRSKAVDFEERNVRSDPRALAELQRKTHQNQVPVLRVGEEYVVGYDPKEIDRALESKAG